MKLLLFKKVLKSIYEPSLVFEQKYAVDFGETSTHFLRGINECLTEDKLIDEYRGFETLSVHYKIVDVNEDDFAEVKYQNDIS